MNKKTAISLVIIIAVISLMVFSYFIFRAHTEKNQKVVIWKKFYNNTDLKLSFEYQEDEVFNRQDDTGTAGINFHGNKGGFLIGVTKQELGQTLEGIRKSRNGGDVAFAMYIKVGGYDALDFKSTTFLNETMSNDTVIFLAHNRLYGIMFFDEPNAEHILNSFEVVP